MNDDTTRDGDGHSYFNPISLTQSLDNGKRTETTVRRRDEPSAKQQELLAYLRRYMTEKGYAPTRIECARAIQASQANIDYHLQRLAISRWIEITPHAQRGLRLLRQGVPLIDAASGEGLDEADPDRPRLDGLAAVFGVAPDLFVRAGNDSMARAGVRRGDLVALTQNRDPEQGDLVAVQIDDQVEIRRFVRTEGGDRLEPEPEGWADATTPVWANAKNVRMLGVEIGSTVSAESRKSREREHSRARRERSQGLER